MDEFLNMQVFSGQGVLVTGSSRGIGQAIAIAFARHGATVIINYRNDEEGAQQTLASIQESGGKGFLYQADVGKPDEIESMVEYFENQITTIDVLINNAAAFSREFFLNVTLEDFDRLLATNVRGPFYLSQLVARHMLNRRKGNIIHISSILARQVVPTRTAYAATKGAIESLTKAMALDLIPHGIRVNAIAPGLIRTETMLAGFPDLDLQTEVEHYIPGGFFGEPKDIADACLFLASDLASYINGIILPVDQGLSVREAGPVLKMRKA
jgi:3-oxoacyl-[acyl-carrier protein] reductase